MVVPRLCKFYKDSGSLDEHQAISYCDLDSDQVTCTGDIDSCPKSDSLKRYFFEQMRRGRGLEGKGRKSPFSEDPKARA